MTGVLAGIEDAAGADLRGVEAFVGTSAGAIVAARLAAGRRRCAGRRAPGRAAGRREAERRRRPPRPALRTRGALGLGRRRRRWRRWPPRSRRPGGALAALGHAARARPTPGARSGACTTRSSARARASTGACGCAASTSARAGASSSGRPARPRASVADAVTASCAIPWVFAPVRIGEREYVDGGVWSVTNLDAAPARRDTEVLCLDPTGVAALAAAPGLPRGHRGRAADPAPARRARAPRRPRRRGGGGDGHRLHGHGAVRAALAAGYAQGRALGGA